MEKINRECKNEKHVRRDNKFGITWCIRCGRLFTKPSGKELTKEDKLRFNCLQPLLCAFLIASQQAYNYTLVN